MAEVRKRGDSYQISVYIGRDADGKKNFERMTWKAPAGLTPKKEEAELNRQVVLFEEKVKDGKILHGGDTFFKDYAALFLEKTNRKKLTMEAYKNIINIVNHYIGNVKLKDIKKATLQQLYSDMRNKATTNYYQDKTFIKYVDSLHVTQRKQAEIIGISIQTIYRLRAGETITEKKAQEISANTGKPISELFTKIVRPANYSYKTLKNCHMLIHSILEDAFDNDMIEKNVASKKGCFNVVNDDPFKIEILTEEQEQDMYSLLFNEPEQFRHQVMLTINTGIRRGELCGLKWEDIDFNNRYMLVGERTIIHSVDTGDFVQKSAKTTTSRRIIALSDEVIQILKAQEQYQKAYAESVAEIWQDEGWVFTSWDGSFYHPNSFTVAFKKFIRKNGLPDHMHVHSLRHCFASNCYDMTNNLKMVSTLLGHSSTDVTDKIYTHIIEKRKAESMDLIGKKFPSYDELLAKKSVICPSKTKNGAKKPQISMD